MITDRLTGLLTKRAFLDLLTGRRTGALLYVDIVSLAFSNAVLGPTATDGVLVTTAALLEATCPGGIAARVGSDEFVVFIDDSTDAHRLSDVLSSAFESQFAEQRATLIAGASNAGVIDPPTRVLTLRIGVANLAEHPDLEAALKAAESALN